MFRIKVRVTIRVSNLMFRVRARVRQIRSGANIAKRESVR